MLTPKRRLRDHWFFGPVLQSSPIYSQVILASVLINLFALASSLYIMTVYDRVIPNNAIESLFALTTIVIVVILFDFVMKIVRARLLPQDVADVTLNQMARISLSAYDVSRYGALEGSVIHVASNTTEQEGIPPFYETLIAIPDPVFATTGVAPDIVPGMQVTVDIIGGKRTVMDYVLSPIQRATEVAFREK